MCLSTSRSFFLMWSSPCVSGRTFGLHRTRRAHRHWSSRLRLHSPPHTRHGLQEENQIQEGLRPGPGFCTRHERVCCLHGDSLHAAQDWHGRRRDRVQGRPHVQFTGDHEHVWRGGRQWRRPSAGHGAADDALSSTRRCDQPGREEPRRWQAQFQWGQSGVETPVIYMLQLWLKILGNN